MSNESWRETGRRAASRRFGWAKLRRRSAGAALLALLAGCGPSAPDLPPAPPDLLPPTALVPLLVELHLAEARAQHASRAADTIQALYAQQETAIFRRRQLTARQFQASYAYYAARPAELEAIYATLVDSLAMREVRLRSVGTPAAAPH